MCRRRREVGKISQGNPGSGFLPAGLGRLVGEWGRERGHFFLLESQMALEGGKERWPTGQSGDFLSHSAIEG